MKKRSATTLCGLHKAITTEAVTPSGEGSAFLRQSRALQLLGVGPGHAGSFTRQGKVTPLRVRCKPGQKASKGIIVLWPVAQIAALWWQRQTSRSHRPWRSTSDDQLLERAGSTPMPQLAATLGRSPRACRKRLYTHGLNERCNQGQLTTGDVAGLCRRSILTVQNWCRWGLAFQRINARGDRMITRENLIRFLKRRRDILDGLDPFTRRKLGLSVHDLVKQEAA